MLTLSKAYLRYKIQYPLRYSLDLIEARMRSKAPVICRILIASDDLAFTSEQQFAPLLASRRLIRDELGVVFDKRLIKDFLASSKENAAHYDAAFLKLSFVPPPRRHWRKSPAFDAAYPRR